MNFKSERDSVSRRVGAVVSRVVVGCIDECWEGNLSFLGKLSEVQACSTAMKHNPTVVKSPTYFSIVLLLVDIFLAFCFSLFMP